MIVVVRGTSELCRCDGRMNEDETDRFRLCVCVGGGVMMLMAVTADLKQQSNI